MNFKNKLFLSLLVSFILLLGSLVISYQNIKNNNDLLKSIEKKQIKLSYFTNKINHDIEMNQANILQSIILENRLDLASMTRSFDNFLILIHKLKKYVDNSAEDSAELQKLISTLKNRTLSYKAVQNSLLEAIQSQELEDIQDATIGFDSVTLKFEKDLERLIDISNEQLYQNISTLQSSNQRSINTLIISFLISFFLISFSIRKFNDFNIKIKEELKRAEIAEEQQKKLQSQLLSYNDDLEAEVSKKSQELHEKMYTHFLTGLPNRNKLLEDTQKYTLKQMALLNIDKFQRFNDVYGEEVGNIAIAMSADFLKSQIHDEDTLLYHIGGDEFVIVVKNSDALSNLYFTDMIERILDNYTKKTFTYEDKKFNFIMSAGLAFSGRRKMLAYADMALKDAKTRNIQVSIFNDNRGLEKIHKEDIACHKKLLYAFDNKQVFSYFQPIIPIQDSNLVTKYESLVRLKDENGKIIPPFNFINVAKANRIYEKLTKIVLENTLNTIEKYKVPCSLNLSIVDIESKETLAMIYKRFDEFDYNEFVTIELLETEEFKDYESVYKFCTKIRSYGIKIALDDFGSGYSNFSHILKLPVDYIKIDASLISNIDRDPHARLMVETIVGLAHKLHVKTIAEFVSSQSILDVVKELNVDYAQGFHLGKPEPIEMYLNL